MQANVARLSAAALVSALLAVVISIRTPSVHARGAAAVATASTASVLKLGTTSTAEADEQLREALRATRPEIRAVAARAVWLSRNAALVPTVAAALQEEQVAFAAREQIRAIAAAETRTIDQPVFDAWKTFGVGFAADSALVFAQARGPAAIAALPRLRDAAVDHPTQMAFVLVATRRDAAAVTAAASQMLEAKEWPSLRVVLDTADVAGTPIGVKVMTAILASADEPARVSGLWHLLGAETVSDRLRASVRATELGAPSGSPDAVLVTEFAGRLLGKAPRTDPAWRKVVAAPHPDLARPIDPVLLPLPPELEARAKSESVWFRRPLVAALVTNAELITLRDAHALPARQPEDLLPRTRKTVVDETRLPYTRLASGFPPALVSDVLAETGCTPGSKTDARAGARITAAVDGRVRVDQSMAHDASRPCIDAATTLLQAFAIEPRRDGRHAPRQAVLLPLSTRYIACASRETGPLAPPDTPPRSTGRPLRLFAGTSSVHPTSGVYSGAMALLISSTGCLHDLIILGGGADQTHWSMIKKTLKKSFRPLVVGATPVASRRSITFEIRPYPDNDTGPDG